jgi:uncharacterized membrane protein YfcA
MLLLSYIGLRINKHEQRLKIVVGRGIVQSDIRYSGKQLRNLLLGALFGGWVSGALGLGGGSIFNPLMISLGVPPSVSTATGMYMILWSASASSIMYYTFGTLNVTFALWLSFWCCIGIVVGVSLVNYLIKIYGRQSILVFFLVFMLGLSAVMCGIDLIIAATSTD